MQTSKNNVRIDSSKKLCQISSSEYSNSSHTVSNCDKSDVPNDSMEESCFSVFSQFKLEVVMFLYNFSYSVRYISSISMVMDKVCLVHLGYSERICYDLAHYEDIKTQVEKIANNYQIGHTMLQLVPSCFVALFIGAWSDKYGRKMPIIGALIGILLDGFGTIMSAAFFKSRVEFYLVPAIFTGLSGGFISVLTIIYSYVSDVTHINKRTMKYALMDVAYGVSLPLGTLVGGWTYKSLGYVPVFVISVSGHILCLIWVIFLIKETRGLDNKDNWIEKLRYLFSTDQVIDSIKTTFKKRPNKGRKQLIVIIIAASLSALSFASTSVIDFLYVHHRYNWGNTKFSTVSAIFSSCGMVTMLVAVPVFKKLKLDDPALGIVGTVSLLLKNITVGLASTVKFYFLGNFLGLLVGLSSLAARTRTSKVTSKDDLGKVFAFLTTAESILPILSIAVASQIFNLTLSFYPGFVYLVLAGLATVPLGIYIWLAFLPVINDKKRCNEEK